MLFRSWWANVLLDGTHGLIPGAAWQEGWLWQLGAGAGDDNATSGGPARPGLRGQVWGPQLLGFGVGGAAPVGDVWLGRVWAASASWQALGFWLGYITLYVALTLAIQDFVLWIFFRLWLGGKFLIKAYYEFFFHELLRTAPCTRRGII